MKLRDPIIWYLPRTADEAWKLAWIAGLSMGWIMCRIDEGQYSLALFEMFWTFGIFIPLMIVANRWASAHQSH